MKKWLTMMLVIALTIVFVGCNNPIKDVEVTSVSVTADKTTIEIDEVVVLKVDVAPENATDKKVTYTSSPAGVVEVTTAGSVKGLKVGNATITVTSKNGKTTSINIEVVEKPSIAVTSVEASVENTEMKVGDTRQITAVVLPENATNKKVVYSSSDKTIATVDTNGMITAVKKGQVTITVASESDSTKKKNISISVEDKAPVVVAVESVEASVAKNEIFVAETLQVNAKALPENATNKKLNYTSSNLEIATVDANGLVRGISDGIVTITITSDSNSTKKQAITIKVNKNEPVVVAVESVEASVAKNEIFVAETLQVNAIVLPENATNKKLNYTSSNLEVVTVDANGLITAHAVGEATITITSDSDSSKNATITIKVKAVVEEIIITGAPATMTVGTTAKLAANKESVVWASSAHEVATIAEDGTVTAHTVGTVTITATLGELTKSVTIEVKAVVEEIIITGAPATMDAGTTAKLVANKEGVVWTSSAHEVATITEDGTVTAHAAGTVTITATLGELTKSITIEVKAEAEYAITGPAKRIGLVGSEYKLYGNRNNIVWSSSETAIATVSEDGVVKILAEGSVIIRGTSGEITKEVEFVGKNPVAEPTLKLKNSSDKTYLFVGLTLSLKVEKIAAPLEKVENAIFSSNDDTIARVTFTAGEATATVRGVAAGTVTILVESGEEYGFIELEVRERSNPTSLTISGSKVEEGQTMRLTVTAEPEGAFTDVTWESLDTAFLTVDSVGVVKGLKEGAATVRVTSTKDPSVVVDHVIQVTAKWVEEEVPAPVSISIRYEGKDAGTADVYVGSKIQLNAVVFPSEASQEVVWSTSSKNVELTADGVVKGVKEKSSATIVATAKHVDKEGKVTTVTQKITIKVASAPAPLPLIDLKGYEIVILNADSAVWSDDPRLPGTPGYQGQDKQYRIDAMNWAENTYKAVFKAKAFPDSAPWGPQRIDWIQQATLNQTVTGDIYVVSTDWIPDLVNAKSLSPVTAYYKKYGKGQMEPGSYESTLYKDELYGVSTGTNVRNFVDRGLFYNVAFLEKYNLESPAAIFNRGEWTYEKFVEYVKQAQSVLPDDHYVLSGHPYYYWAYMVNSGGVRIADTANLKLNFKSPVAKQAAMALKEIHAANAFDPVYAYDQKVTSFNDQKALMQSADMWFLGDSTRWPNNHWGDDTRFGYVPYPRPNGIEKSAARLVTTGGSAYVMSSGKKLPEGVTQDGIYRVFVESHIKKGQLMDEDPTFNGMDYRIREAEAKLSDSQSIDAVLYFGASKQIYDPFTTMIPPYTAGSLSPALISVIGKDGKDFEEAMDSNKATLEEFFFRRYAK